MELLLDTHVFLWLTATPERLGDTQAVLADPAHDVLLDDADITVLR